MIITRFEGGLGNQMFHYVAYKLLQQKYSDYLILADITGYNRGQSHNGFELERVFPNVCIEKARIVDVVGCSFYFPTPNNKFFWRNCDKLYNKLKQYGCIAPPTNYICERDWEKFQHNMELSIEKKYYIDCKWDYNESYYKEWKEKLLYDFQFATPLDDDALQNVISEVETVGIHVRAGDYINSNFDILTSEYYKQAIEYVLAHIHNPYFIIVSDDYVYAKKILPLNRMKNVHFATMHIGREAYKDMQILSCCQHNIIANSTFSYWAAELNRNERKIVVAPRKYTKNGNDFCVPSGWIQLDL